MIDFLKIKASYNPAKGEYVINIDYRDYCPKCGKKNYSRGSHCAYCGATLKP